MRNILISLFLLAIQGILFSQAPQIWISRSIDRDTICYEGAPDSTTATVTLRAWASEDSILTGYPMDILFSCDLSGSMSYSAGIPSRWRITWSQISGRRFVDSLNQGYDRVSIMGWTSNAQGYSLADTSNINRYVLKTLPLTGDFLAAKRFMADSLYLHYVTAYTNHSFNSYDTVWNALTPGYDTLWRSRVTDRVYGNTPLNISTVVGLKYLRAHATNSAAMIILTDGLNNDGVSNAYTFHFLDSIYTNYGIRTYVIGFLGGDMNYLRALADTGGGAAYEANTPAQLDSIFQIISLQLSDVVGTSIAPGSPTLIDVMGAGIHFVPGSYLATSGTGYIVPTAYTVDTVSGRTRMNFVVDTIRAGKILEIKYRITAALATADIYSAPAFWTNNTRPDDAVNYSFIRYLNTDDSTVIKSFTKNHVHVKSGIEGLYLSLRPDTVILPSQTRVVPLSYTFAVPAVYPDTNMYSVLKIRATSDTDFISLTSIWNFHPDAGWTAPVLNNVSTDNRSIGVTAPYNYTANCTLSVSQNLYSADYSDFLIFSAFDNSGAPQVVRVVIDNDTNAAGYIDPPRLVWTGNQTQLEARSQNLFARGITDRGVIQRNTASWTVSGFTLYQSYLNGIISGASKSQEQLVLLLRDTNICQSDSGFITIDSAGMTYSVKFVFLDTTDYDTTDHLAIYDTAYGGVKSVIESYYALQASRSSYSKNLGDSVTLWGMRFDKSGSAVEYLGTGAVTWQLNSGAPFSRATFGIRGTQALATDRIIASYVNEFGVELRDTCFINWGFGTSRILSLETQPGVLGSTQAFPAETLLVSNTADTVWGLYAVVRDEYGNCVYDGFGWNYATWALAVSGMSAYLDIPADSNSEGFVHRKLSPPTDTAVYLRVIGLNFNGLLGQTDSVLVRLTEYTHDLLEIVAGANIQGYSVGDIIPRDTVIRLRCDLPGHFQAKARHDLTLYDYVSVTWSIENGTVVAGAFPQNGTDVILDPVTRTTAIRLYAVYYTGSTTLRDTLRFLVEPPVLTGVSMDSVKSANSGLAEITVRGNLAQIRATSFKLYSNGLYSCTGEAGGVTPSNWSTTITDHWFMSMVNQMNACSVLVNLSNVPAGNGNHSRQGTIRIQNGMFWDEIIFRLIDTTDYDTLERLIADTTDYSSAPFLLPADTVLKTMRVYSLRAGESLTLYPLLFDLNTPSAGVLTPKLIGVDTVSWQIKRGATGAITDTVAASMTLSGTVAGVSDTLRLSYPAPGRRFTDDAYPMRTPPLTFTVVVMWQAGSQTFLRIVSSDQASASALSGDTVSMSSTDTGFAAYAYVYDQYNNFISNADKETWSVTANAYVSVPTDTTHIGLVVKSGFPPMVVTYRVVSELPAGVYLGNGRYAPAYALRDTFYIRTGNFVIDSIRILGGDNGDAMATLPRGILPDSTVVGPSDTVVLRVCDNRAVFLAQIHSTDASLGDNGWVFQNVAWSYDGQLTPATVFTVNPRDASPLETLTVHYQGLSSSVRIRALDEYFVRLFIQPSYPNRRAVVAGDTASLNDQTLTLSLIGRTNCGYTIPASALWSASGFTDPGWQASFNAQFSPVAVNSYTLGFDNISMDTVKQSDSGYIVVTFLDTLNGTARLLTDTLKLVIQDNTDYDTVKAVAIVPDSAYRTATDKNALYDQYNFIRRYTPMSGDTVRFNALLFDINPDGRKFLGSYSVPYNGARVFWYLNGALVNGMDSVFELSRGMRGTDTVVAVYGNSAAGALMKDTLILTWTYGRERILHLESSPGAAGTAASPLDSIVFDLNKTTDTVYAVIRDEFGAFVSNAPLEKWSMMPVTYLNYLSIPNGSVPTNLGRLVRVNTPSSEQRFDFIAKLDRFTEVAGVQTTLLQADTVKIVLANYSFDSLEIRCSAGSVTGSSGHIYYLNESIPRNDTLQLTACEDTMVLKSMLRRDDTQAWSLQPADWGLTNFACLATASFAAGPTVTVAPRYGVSLDTLFSSYLTGSGVLLTDTVYFSVERPWISRIIVVPGDTSLTAGDSFTFIIYALDKNGDTVKSADRLPDSLSISVNDSVYYSGAGLNTIINNGTLIVRNPFTNGLSSNTVVPYYYGTNRIIFQMAFPAGNGSTQTYRDTLYLSVSPSEARSIRVVFDAADSIEVLRDTLMTYGDNLMATSAYYRVQLFDQWDNPLPSSSASYLALTDTVMAPLIGSRFERVGNDRFKYDAASSPRGGSGTITITLPRPGDTLTATPFTLVVIPLVRVTRIATYDWVADTAGHGISVAYVLDSVIGVHSAGMTSRQRLDTLASRGYMSYRDGYLDYLTLTLSEPFKLTTDLITRIAFSDTLTNGASDTVEWALSDALRTIRLIPADTLPRQDSLHAAYRLWLIPHSRNASANAPMETGLLPSLTFSNKAIKDKNWANTFPILIGNANDAYTTARALTLDSAAPVISDFVLQNNNCNVDNPKSLFRIMFSEPVNSAGFPTSISIRAFTLINGNQADSGFMAIAIDKAGRKEDASNDISDWNYGKDASRMMVYEGIINPAYDYLFIPNKTKIRFSGDALISQVRDEAGNNACGLPNRARTLINDPSSNIYICKLTGPTVVSRYDAMNYSWNRSPDPADHDSLVPSFPFFGFSLAPELLNNNSGRNMVISHGFLINGSEYVICDLDTSYAFVIVDIIVFDLLGNLTASPASHPKTLHMDYTVKTIQKLTGMDDIIANVERMSQKEIDDYFSTSPGTPPFPDTLRPRYPKMVDFDYQYMSDMCGPFSGEPLCVPSWNCLNAKGRLVAPGGYIVMQSIRTGGIVTVNNKKLIVTSGTGKR